MKWWHTKGHGTDAGIAILPKWPLRISSRKILTPSLAFWKKQLKTPISGKPSQAARTFDPATIPPFSVIRCNYHFDGDPSPLPNRRFVCLCHKTLQARHFAICLKATSQLDSYRNNPQRMPGVVFYRAGLIPFFEKDTIVDPDNPFPIPHFDLIKQHLSGGLKILGALPEDFPEVLAKAVRASVTMSPREQRRILEILGT